ncbi:FAD binding domain-containing protein [Kyrpidia tusciae]|uniref:Molybdopterin dehydrogenase FAD-binding protein n=1 Tax=Kyrpidia tusciae (strain DSM 2912 / NBRC 15312 / T2) TaxID=562970 RepID=D5WS50_KYRT2|nr:FAD binding domain-containing protein [Kyrpidia tusciae]ADG07002.1 molybdopterin dehydrogenase FAD-binding protein [Kyrpidia tusciae DSM 2912]
MKPAAFEYYRPKDLEDALRFLRDVPGSKVIAGGQSLIPLMNFRLSRPSALVDLNAMDELREVRLVDGALRIGGMVRHEELRRNPLICTHLPILAEAAGHIGHWAIRTRGTLGGSLAHADPAAELPAAVTALGGVIELANADGIRRVSAEDFFLGYLMTDLQSDEILTAVEIPLSEGISWGFHEFARRSGDFALAGAFVEWRGGDAGAVTWFGIGGRPERHEVVFDKDEAARRAMWEKTVLQADVEDNYRRRLGVLAAETAYRRALGRDGA